MAKITVDGNLCTGCGLCVDTCPEIFEMGDDNVARVKDLKSASCDLKDVAESCPVEAIAVK